MAKDKWIQKAHVKKGALSKQLGVPENKDIPMSKLNKAAKSKDPTLRKRAVLAKTFKKMSKKK